MAWRGELGLLAPGRVAPTAAGHALTWACTRGLVGTSLDPTQGAGGPKSQVWDPRKPPAGPGPLQALGSAVCGSGCPSCSVFFWFPGSERGRFVEHRGPFLVATRVPGSVCSLSQQPGLTPPATRICSLLKDTAHWCEGHSTPGGSRVQDLELHCTCKAAGLQTRRLSRTLGRRRSGAPSSGPADVWVPCLVPLTWLPRCGEHLRPGSQLSWPLDLE